jgi:hypothetical protein
VSKLFEKVIDVANGKMAVAVTVRRRGHVMELSQSGEEEIELFTKSDALALAEAIREAAQQM